MATPRSRVLIVGITAAGCALLGGVLGLAITDSGSGQTVAVDGASSNLVVPDSTATTVPAATSTSAGVPPSVTTEPPPPPSTATTAPPPAPVGTAPAAAPAPEGLADPSVTARRFAAEYWSWRWDEPDGAQLTRARPYITDRFAASWAQSSSAAAAVAARRARHEVETPTFTHIYQHPEQQGLWLVRGSTTVTGDGLAPRSRPIESTLIILNRNGWRVDSVQLG
jgi:hypothetical protein